MSATRYAHKCTKTRRSVMFKEWQYFTYQVSSYRILQNPNQHMKKLQTGIINFFEFHQKGCMNLNDIFPIYFWRQLLKAGLIFASCCSIIPKENQICLSCFFFDSVLSADLFFLVGNYTNSLSLRDFFCFEKSPCLFYF